MGQLSLTFKNACVHRKGNEMIKEFQKFIMRGNVLDLAVGIIIGAAFTAIVTSLVKDVIMPPVGLLLGGVDFSNIFIPLRDGAIPGPYASVQAAQDAGAVTINIGLFINALISFLIVAIVVFLDYTGLQQDDGTLQEE